jgi:predicted nucleic acid-binding Zn ribbon protein
MKKIKDKSCCVCGESFKPQNSLQQVCSHYCAKAKAIERDKKKPKKKVKLIAPMSKKLASRLVVYRIRRDAYMKTNTVCECVGCASPSNDLHHKAGRIGDNLINEENFMSVCRRCHNWIHEHPKESRELNYLK